MRTGWRILIILAPVFWNSYMPREAPAQDRQSLLENVDTPTRDLLARSGADYAAPYTTLRVHNVGNLRFSVTNWGLFGSLGGELRDPETGQPAEGAYFPAGSYIEHLYLGALWVGAVVHGDTLVSTAHDGFYRLTEFYPESYSHGGGIRERSSRLDSPLYDPDAISEQDFICTYFDTLAAQAYVPVDQWSWRPHTPIQIRVRQESFAWPYEYAEDFVIIRYWIVNLSDDSLAGVRVGFLIDPQVHHINNIPSMWDDHVGFRETMPSITGYGFIDTLRMIWFADNGGDPIKQSHFDEMSPLSAGGISIIGTPLEIHYAEYWWRQEHCWQTTYDYSFNWWTPSSNARYDWGPQHSPADQSWIGGLGQPLGDRHRYRVMANGEMDYDQFWANTSFAADGWIPPPWKTDPYFADNLARGYPTQALLSVGPFGIGAGDSIPIAIAFAAGDGFHYYPRNVKKLPSAQDQYVENLDFSDLVKNIQWAKWIYDNPGRDTDEDGCPGNYFLVNCRDTILTWNGYEYRDEVCDTIYYCGDGVVDLKGPPPPPSPNLHISSEPGKIHLGWDGRLSELLVDDFSHRVDFEGYNVYVGLGHSPNTLALMASWDRINYDRYRYVPQARPSPWVNPDRPLTVDELEQLYGREFDPRLHSSPVDYFEDEEGNRFYFKPHGGNRNNEYTENGGIVFNPIQYVRTDSLWDENQQTWRLFGHYECTVEGLLPSQPYYFAVTSFDHGFAEGGLGPLESSTQTNLQLAYPSYTPEYVAEKRLRVTVYPNPYKINAGYRESGFEDPNRSGFLERTRRIHFVNLPPQATIKIFSLDGDLIREIHHPDSRLSDTPSHTAWDLITRNTQAVVSGIYLYSVESDWGTQIGKIVIIK